MIAPELLCEIYKYLSKNDCYNAMFVSHYWYTCLKHQFYKTVDIKSTLQLDAFLHTLERSRTGNKKREEYTELGYMVKELRLVSYGMGYQIIALTQDKLNTLSDLCPRLEVLEFDSSQWANMNDMSVFESWKHLKSIAPLHCKHLHGVSFTPQLTQLRIFHTSQEENQLYTVFPNMTFLKHLTLDIFCGQPNAYTGMDVDHYLKMIHTTVPQLESLCLILTNSRSDAPNPNAMHNHSRINLKSLSLTGIPVPSHWFHYILKNYPRLESLEISDPIIGQFNPHLYAEALVLLVQQLSLLKKLSLKGTSVGYLYSDALINELARSGVRQFEYDFPALDLNKSIKFLNAIEKCPLKQLQKLQIGVANQRFSWPGSLQSLYGCSNLVDLDLWFVRGFMDPHQYTDFVLDDFLGRMPQIKRLRLKEASVRLGGYDGTVSLQVLDLGDSLVLDMEGLCQFFSKQCTSLTQLSLALSEGAVTLDLANRRLEKLRLSYARTSNCFLNVVPLIENQPDLKSFSLTKEKHHGIWVSVDQLEDGDWRKDLKLISSQIRIHCKSLRRLYVDATKLSTSLLSL